MEERSPDRARDSRGLPEIEIQQPPEISCTPASSVVFSTQQKLPSPDGRHTTTSSRSGSARPSPKSSPAASPRISPKHLAVPQQKAFGKRRSLSMLSSQSETHIKAHETRKSFQRPKFWVLSFGWFLASCAGFVNTVSFLTWGAFASHMTGTSSKIGLRLEGYHHDETPMSDMTQALLMVFSFVLGSFTCGLLIDKNQVHFGGKSWYGVALVGNAALIFAAALIPEKPHLSVCLAAGACGLQNAMCTSHFGAVVRTTHVTGTLTDIGSTLGRIAMIYLRKGCRRSYMNVLEKAEVGVDARKLLVLLPMWIFFVMGSTIGAYAEYVCGPYALFFPASLTFTIGLAYMCLRQMLDERFNRIEQEALMAKLADMQQAFLRTGTKLSEVESSGVASSLQEIDDEMGQMLEVLSEMENGVANVVRRESRKQLPDQCASSTRTHISGVSECV